MYKRKILIIDDEKEMAQLLQIELMSEDYEVILAYEGRSGLAMIKSMKPDLVVLDVMLPGMDGYQVLEFMKKDDELKNIPVVMLTAKGLEEDIQKGLNLGADDYIPKPFHAGLLLKRIRNVLSGR